MNVFANLSRSHPVTPPSPHGALQASPSDPLGPVDHPFEPIPWSAIETSLFRRFEETAERHAGRLAVQDCTTALTYSELTALVRRIATLDELPSCG